MLLEHFHQPVQAVVSVEAGSVQPRLVAFVMPIFHHPLFVTDPSLLWVFYGRALSTFIFCPQVFPADKHCLGFSYWPIQDSGTVEDHSGEMSFLVAAQDRQILYESIYLNALQIRFQEFSQVFQHLEHRVLDDAQ